MVSLIDIHFVKNSFQKLKNELLRKLKRKEYLNKKKNRKKLIKMKPLDIKKPLIY